MLKRQRPSSPIPILPDTAEENQLPDDLYEPMSKRRRFYAPPGVGTTAQHERQRGEEGDFNSLHVSAIVSRSVDGGAKGWQKGPGEYKDANTLLHDLHAEQRHRIMFSPNKSPTTTPSYINDILNPQPSVAKHFGTPPPAAQWSHELPSTQVSEFVEAQVVAQRYGETNRLLRTLVLSRRQGSSTT